MREAMALNERCAAIEMGDHEFLDDSFRRQRAVYGDGTTVTIDLDARSFDITAR
jgi:hypothetical protein